MLPGSTVSFVINPRSPSAMYSARRLSALAAPVAIAAILSASAPAARAVTVDFSGTQYADSFTETFNGGVLNATGGELQIANTSSASGVAIYNNEFPSSGVTGFTMSVDAKFATLSSSAFDGNSIGLVTNVRNDNGYAVIFRIRTSSGQSFADIRLFSINTVSGAVVQIGSTQTLGSAQLGATFAANTFYQFDLSVSTATAGNIEFTGAILSADGTSTIGSFGSFSTTYTANSTPTYAGLRLGTQGNGTLANSIVAVDNLTLSAIPEPSSFAALGGLAVLACAALRRRRA